MSRQTQRRNPNLTPPASSSFLEKNPSIELLPLGQQKKPDVSNLTIALANIATKAEQKRTTIAFLQRYSETANGQAAESAQQQPRNKRHKFQIHVKRKFLAFYALIGQILNKINSAVFKLQGFEKHLGESAGHSISIPVAIQAFLITARAVCVMFVSAGKSYEGMRRRKFSANSVADITALGREEHWLERTLFEAEDTLKLQKEKIFIYMLVRIAERDGHERGKSLLPNVTRFRADFLANLAKTLGMTESLFALAGTPYTPNTKGFFKKTTRNKERQAEFSTMATFIQTLQPQQLLSKLAKIWSEQATPRTSVSVTPTPAQETETILQREQNPPEIWDTSPARIASPSATSLTDFTPAEHFDSHHAHKAFDFGRDYFIQVQLQALIKKLKTLGPSGKTTEDRLAALLKHQSLDAAINKMRNKFVLHYNTAADETHFEQEIRLGLYKAIEEKKLIETSGNPTETTKQLKKLKTEQLKKTRFLAQVDWRLRKRFEEKRELINSRYALRLNDIEKEKCDELAIALLRNPNTDEVISQLQTNATADLQRYNLGAKAHAGQTALQLGKKTFERRFKKRHGTLSKVLLDESSERRAMLVAADSNVKEMLANVYYPQALNEVNPSSASLSLERLRKDAEDKAITEQLDRLGQKGFFLLTKGQRREDYRQKLEASRAAQQHSYLLELVLLKKRLLQKTIEQELKTNQTLYQHHKALRQTLEASLLAYIQQQEHQRKLLKTLGADRKEIQKLIAFQHNLETKNHRLLVDKHEKRLGQFAFFISVCNTTVFTCLSAYATMHTFTVALSVAHPIAIGAAVAIGLVTMMVSWFFAKPKIVASLCAMGRHMDKRQFKNKDGLHSKEFKAFTKIFSYTAMASAFAFLQLFAVKGLIIKGLMAASVAASAATPIGWAIGGVLVLFATIASASLLRVQIGKLFSHAAEGCGQHSALYQKAKANGALGRFRVKVAIGLLLATITATLGVMGDYFGLHAIVPIVAFDLVMSTLSAMGNISQNFSDGAAGTVKAFDNFSELKWVKRVIKFVGLQKKYKVKTQPDAPRETQSTAPEDDISLSSENISTEANAATYTGIVRSIKSYIIGSNKLDTTAAQTEDGTIEFTLAETPNTGPTEEKLSAKDVLRSCFFPAAQHEPNVVDANNNPVTAFSNV